MNYHNIGWRDNNDGQGQAYRNAVDRPEAEEASEDTIICTVCGAVLPLDRWTARHKQCAKHADGE